MHASIVPRTHRQTSTALQREAPDSDIFIARHQCRTIKTGSCHFAHLRTDANLHKHFHARRSLHTHIYLHMPNPSGILALGMELATRLTFRRGLHDPVHLLVAARRGYVQPWTIITHTLFFRVHVQIAPSSFGSLFGTQFEIWVHRVLVGSRCATRRLRNSM